jgi:hypothetical protein
MALSTNSLKSATSSATHPVQEKLQADRSPVAPSGPIYDDEGQDDDGEYKIPLLTNAPPPREGFAQRWIRLSALGVEDIAHVMRMRNLGWSPRSPDTVPTGFFAPVVPHASLGNVISNGDMLLMERPMRLQERQRKMVEQLTRNQTGAVEQYLARNAPGGRGFGQGEVSEFSRKVTTGRVPRIAD